MRFFAFIVASVCLSSTCIAGPLAEELSKRQDRPSSQNKHLRPVVEKRQQFAQGEPVDANGKGCPILGRPLLSQSQQDCTADARQVAQISSLIFKIPTIWERKAPTMEWLSISSGASQTPKQDSWQVAG